MHRQEGLETPGRQGLPPFTLRTSRTRFRLQPVRGIWKTIQSRVPQHRKPHDVVELGAVVDLPKDGVKPWQLQRRENDLAREQEQRYASMEHMGRGPVHSCHWLGSALDGDATPVEVVPDLACRGHESG